MSHSQAARSAQGHRHTFECAFSISISEPCGRVSQNLEWKHDTKEQY